MIEYRLADLTLDGNNISGNLDPIHAREIMSYANTNDLVEIKLLVVAKPRGRSQPINVVRKEAGMPTYQLPPSESPLELPPLKSLGAPQGTVMAGPHQSRAMRIVSDYIRGHLEKTDPVPEFDIYIVWFCFTLGNWKALISTTLPDQMYYEVTHDKAKRCTYLDVYKKFSNQIVPD